MNKLPVTFSKLLHHCTWASHFKCLCRKNIHCRRQQPWARGWAGLPQNIRKFLTGHTA